MMDKEKMISFLRNVHNLTITMKNKNGKVVYYPSLLIEELNLCVEEGKISSTRYSLKQAQLEVAKYKDLYRLYGVNNQYINNFSDEQLRYMKYDHHFKELPDYHNDAFVRLSYTQIDEYNKCPFQYFVKRVLKTNIFEDSFETRLGSLFHKILEDSISKSIELMDYKEEILETFKSKKEQFFVKLLLPQIKDVLKKNADFDNVTCFSHKLAESEFVVDIDENTKLMGKIDKTIFDDPNKLLAIVDYKTSNFNFNYNKVQYGLNLQLPIYALMLKDKYPDYQIVGLYIQNVCLNKQQLEEGKPYMLNGLTLSELNKLQRLDKEIGVAKDEEGNIKLKSSYINKLALKKNLELTQTTGYEEEFFDNLIASAKEQIDIAISKIREGKFEIAPKKFKHDKGIVCNYCPCKDICFMDSGDIVILDKEDGGDEDEI